MNGDTLYSIGELARQTGTTVKTIRFYSDSGIVSPADRTPAGHRQYGGDALARLELVRTLRDLGLGLPAIRQVMDRERELPEVAAAQAEALDVQIRTLRLRRAVLTAVAKRGATPEETHLMHKLAGLSDSERRELVDDFLRAVFHGSGSDSDGGGEHAPADDAVFSAVMCSMTPELPADPRPDQIEAWLELAELSQDPGFRDHVRQMVRDHVAGRGQGVPPSRSRDLAATVRDAVAPALAAGVEPDSPEADPFVAQLVNLCRGGRGGGGEGGGGGPVAPLRPLLARLEGLNDPRRERYFRLLAVVNGWPGPQGLHPALDWSVRALRDRVER
ncbi:MerR family transcriptional regulator [Streptomyces sp. NPDC046866]|uniref:MerR family transcriptional regulator n=1 Tax=Streptomyces sp. NPDC046866 TaxID=3154921 RepID=UPI00345715EF